MKSKLLRSFTLFLTLILISGMVLACQVPVFRYALERWMPDPYKLAITPGVSGAFSPDEQAVIDFLKSQKPDPRAESGVFANLAIEIGAGASASVSGASMSIFYPEKVRGFATKPIWEGALTLENAKRLVDSPARREIVKRLLLGQSAIWVMVESGTATADDAAAATVTASMPEAIASLKVPEGVLTPQQAESADNFAAVNADDVLRSEVPLKIDFSLIRIKRDDPAEALLLPMLLKIEDDLGEYASEPMVFPVFGRGRILEPLIGKGIRNENLLEYATYICGACSCEVKDQNPGVDLLIAADWDTALHGSEVVLEKILPPLEGTGAFAAAGDPVAKAVEGQGNVAAPMPVVATGAAPDAIGFPLMTILLTTTAVIGVIAVGTIFLLRRKSP